MTVWKVVERHSHDNCFSYEVSKRKEAVRIAKAMNGTQFNKSWEVWKVNGLKEKRVF